MEPAAADDISSMQFPVFHARTALCSNLFLNSSHELFGVGVVIPSPLRSNA